MWLRLCKKRKLEYQFLRNKLAALTGDDSVIEDKPGKQSRDGRGRWDGCSLPGSCVSWRPPKFHWPLYQRLAVLASRCLHWFSLKHTHTYTPGPGPCMLFEPRPCGVPRGITIFAGCRVWLRISWCKIIICFTLTQMLLTLPGRNKKKQPAAALAGPDQTCQMLTSV